MTFAAHFREHVAPDLLRMAKEEAAYVAVGDQSFLDAYGAVETRARNRGALFLPPPIFAELEDWISITLLEHIQTLEEQFALLETNCRLKVGLGPHKLL